MIESGTLLQDRYLIEKQIGIGGMGAVYLAVDRRFDNYVAIKETFYSDDEFGEAFEREARLLNGLQHPILPHVSDFFTENNGHFLVMQYIEGEDLSETLKREGAFPVEDVLRWANDLLDALDFLHSQQPPVIHRDIKPQNLKLTPRGGIILLDFGLAKLKHEDTSGVKSVFGYSRRYSPLEQIQGTGTDARSDIFSLGATVYHLLTGKQPVEVLARATKIIAGKPDPLQLASEINDKVPIKVAAVLHSALALNPEQRFASADAMRKALEHASNLEEDPRELSEKALVAASTASGSQMISPVETENFPALEAFVDEVKNSAQLSNNEPDADEISIQDVDLNLPAEENLQHSTALTDAPTVAGVNSHRSRLQTLALAALVAILAGAAAGYFIYRASLTGNPAETPIVQSSPELKLNAEQTTTISDSPTEAPETSSLKDVEQAKNKTGSAKTAEREEASEQREVTDDKPDIAVSTEKPKSSQTGIPRRTSVQNTRRTDSEADGETRVRVVKSEPAPDIESIFTGRPSWGNDKKQQQRGAGKRQRDEMSEEEWRELRRERREKRKKRQNEKPIPF